MKSCNGRRSRQRCHAWTSYRSTSSRDARPPPPREPPPPRRHEPPHVMERHHVAHRHVRHRHVSHREPARLLTSRMSTICRRCPRPIIRRGARRHAEAARWYSASQAFWWGCHTWCDRVRRRTPLVRLSRLRSAYTLSLSPGWAACAACCAATRARSSGATICASRFPRRWRSG